MKHRILHLSHLATMSGAEQALLRLLGHPDRARFESFVVLPEDGPLVAAIGALGVETHIAQVRWWIPASHWSAAEFIRQVAGLEERWRGLADLAARERISLIHSNTVVTIEGALAAAALGIPHVWHSRGPLGGGFLPPPYLDDLSFFYSVIDELGDHLVCVSRAVREQALQYVRATPCTAIPDGFDPGPEGRTATTRADFLAACGLAAGSRLIGCIGGVQRRKGQLELIEAFARIANIYPEAVLLLCGAAGDQPYMEQVEACIRELRMAARVRLLGFRSDVWDIVHHCEMVVHPSHSEGFGLATLEAMAAGVPVITTRSGGPEDIIEEGISGLLVAPEAPVELAAAMAALLADTGRAQAIGAAARRRARLFTAAASARRLADLWEQMLAAPAQKPCGSARATAVCARVLARFQDL